MRVCLICEGSYPYVTGGVSSWVHMLMSALEDVEFCILTIASDRGYSGKFKYKLPSNVVEVCETFLQDDDRVKKENVLRMNKAQRKAFRSFIMGTEIDWKTIFEFFSKNDVSVNELLMGKDMLKIIREFYDLNYERLPFSDFLWTYRSMLLPLCLLLKNELPKADLYHSASTGYAGVLACMAKQIYGKPVIITEHGIYTREREEEIIKSEFFEGIYKDIWIQHFYKLSSGAYSYADKIISLFNGARKLQMEIGCDPNKTMVIPNGIKPDRFDAIPDRIDDGTINLGLIARISPIKDIKTLINAFAAAKEKIHNLHLYIMGEPDEDSKVYYQECVDLTKIIDLKDVHFEGTVDVAEYMSRLDIIILTSISEGQPMAILEAMSASRPCIATKVGNCEGLILGEKVGDLPCGLVAPIMSVEQISNAIIELASDPQKRREYGRNGKVRVAERYPLDYVIHTYNNLYRSYS